MKDLEKSLSRWHATKDIALASEICDALYRSSVADILFDKVVEWGREKHIDNPTMQFAKMIEEAGEIAHELTRMHFRTDEMADALGDTLVTLIILADILGYDLKECLMGAYDTIKDRSGHTDGGTFIKDIPDGKN